MRRDGAAVETGLMCLSLVARFHGVATDPVQLAHELGIVGVASLEDLILAGKRLDLRIRASALDVGRCAKGRVPLPCVVELRRSWQGTAGAEGADVPGEAGGATQPGQVYFAVLAQI